MISGRIEEGVVTELLNNNYANVKIPKKTSCGLCDHKGFCNPFGKDHMVIAADNKLKAIVGQKVRIEVRAADEGKAITILYVIPLIAMFIGALIGNALNLFENKDASAAFFSFLFLVITFLAIRYYSRTKYEKNISYKPIIIEIL
ncbi:MAG: SoxR reducing system RseC family protein [Proteobacteria bacterium]|nr:SoxR reducing system RseC family protein [Desulfobacteraceae bacterium]MBU3980524.1 SoxR reducing system RseC family protein [Pseudomonadota bacterium]MBU4013598.1 SoxR reducing system RseC family protein [Pseudomonadota bacterium]MBU4067372.1 SoxR reducing system RseC family protein [Pseudomonadota bacterium]MBU4128303.1 SoxR reducing system RseC family protein [Pseudomonadota bacterium]